MNHLSVADIAGLFPGKSGLPLNRAVKPGMSVSEEALRITAAGGSADDGMGARLSTMFPRTANADVHASLATQFPSNVHGDRRREIELKRMFRNNT